MLDDGRDCPVHPIPRRTTGSGWVEARIPEGAHPLSLHERHDSWRESSLAPRHERLNLTGHDLSFDTDELVLDRALWVGVVPLTEAVVGAVRGTRADCAHCPAVFSGWSDAVRFANEFSAFHGLELCYSVEGQEVRWSTERPCTGYRLPTASEWQADAQAGCEARYAGSNYRSVVAVDGPAGEQSSTPQRVARAAPNGFGLYDLSGGLAEWVWNQHHPDAQVTPRGPSEAGSGPYRYAADNIGSFYRFEAEEPPSKVKVGLRLVRDAER